MSPLEIQLNAICIETYQLISCNSVVFVQLLFRIIALQNKQQQGKRENEKSVCGVGAWVETCPLGNISISWYDAIKNKPNVSLKAAGNKHNTDSTEGTT